MLLPFVDGEDVTADAEKNYSKNIIFLGFLFFWPLFNIYKVYYL